MELVWPQKYQPSPSIIQPLILHRKVDADAGWSHKLFAGDNESLLTALPRHPLYTDILAIGGIKLVYIDPPFAVGKDFRQGDRIAYSDKFALDDYLSFMYRILKLIYAVLAPTGSLYVHCDWHTQSYLRLLLDEIFGQEHFQNEICWAYRSQGASKRRFSRKHDTILFYTKSKEWTFTPEYERSYMQHTYGFAKDDFKIDEHGKQYRDALLRDVWEIPALQSATREKNGYPTQKPEALLRRIITCSSEPGDLVADFFCGSGTTLAVAQQLQRRWLGCDASPLAFDTTQQRLTALGASFEHWQVGLCT
jgi:adenine specific DNA methylase Mod